MFLVSNVLSVVCSLIVLDNCFGLKPIVDENLRTNCRVLILFCLESSSTESCPFAVKIVSTVDFTIWSMVVVSFNRLSKNVSMRFILSEVEFAFKIFCPISFPSFPNKPSISNSGTATSFHPIEISIFST